jgi:RNA recognition motif-containing protein
MAGTEKVLVLKAESYISIVFIGNLSWVVTEEQLRNFVDQVDPSSVISVEIKRHEDTKKSKGWG